VPTVLTLGTKHLVEEHREELLELIKNYVNVLAMNELEAEALTGLADPLLAAEAMLEYVDIVFTHSRPLMACISAVILTTSFKRETLTRLSPVVWADFNRWEFSRPMLREACKQPIKVFSHIDPYMGGPEKSATPMARVMGRYPRYCMIFQQTIFTKRPSQTQANTQLLF